MSEILKLPYEISVWEDELVTLEDGTSYYQEAKKAIIGSDTMTSPSRVFDPVLKVNVNGEKTLTFSLQFKYFDEEVGEVITNPIHPLLINERKVKLYYKNEWYDFIIKECEENQEENTFNYTAKDIFVNELSKQGYAIELDPELNNNLGTAVELGKVVVKNTDWTIDEEDSDLLQQTIEEPLYTCKPKINFTAKNIDDDSIIELTTEDTLYIFYTYITNETGEFLQFILERDRDKWTFDDNDTIVATNYRYEGPFVVDENEKVIEFGEVDAEDRIDAIDIIDPYYEHQAYRLVYQQRTYYDPVMEQYVDLYKANYYNEEQEVYKFTTTEYGTSALAIPYITNNTDFSLDNKNSLSGWDNLNLTTTDTLPEVTLSTYPVLKPGAKLQPVVALNGLSSYLRMNFPNKIEIQNGNYNNLIFNSGFMDMGATIGNISYGEKFVFRIRAGHGDEESKPTPFHLSNISSIHAIVAFYNTETKFIDGNKLELRTFSDKDIILDFNGDFDSAPNIISNGKFNNSMTQYIVDNVVQTPSLKYYYRDKDTSEEDGYFYIWNPELKQYIKRTNSEESFWDYFKTVASAKRTITGKELTDPKVRIGVFIGTTEDGLIGEDQYIYVEDIQIFKYSIDGKKKVVLPGNAPLASGVEKTGYYLKPLEGMTKDDITIYYDKQDLLDDLGVKDEDLIQVYNDNCEKILSIKESKSNCFNILQTICETFECWLKITVEHESNGAISLDENHRPKKKISFKKYVGKENFAGFKYGINLNSITRTLDSNEVVTKLIVADTASDYAEDGNLSISLAESNPTGENIIYNLDYYVQKGLLKNKQQYLEDLGNLYSKTKIANTQLRRLEKEYIKARAALESSTSQANVYTEAMETAQKNYMEALEEFKDKANITYAEYIEEHPDGVEKEYVEAVGKIYAAASFLNNNGGVTTTTREEYKKLKLECEGAKEYSIVVSTTNASDNEEGTIPAKTKLVINDYIEGFVFTFEKQNSSVEYQSSLNDRQFVLESDEPYSALKILQLPDNYKLEYVVDGEKIDSETNPNRIFYIYDEINHTERIRRFKLVPNSEYKEKYKGYKNRIQEKIDEKNSYINNFEHKYSQFIQEGTWESSSYIDSNLYYFDALQVSHTSAKPQVSYTINVTEVSEIDGLENYSFAIGEKTYIEDTEFFGYTTSRLIEKSDWELETVEDEKILPRDEEEGWIAVYTPVREEVILSEIEWHLDDPSENIITIQNYKTQFEDLFQRISATVQSVQYNEANYSRAASILDGNGQINSDLLVKSLASLGAATYPLASDGAIEITDDSLIVKDLANQKNYIRLLGRGLQVSTNGGRTWRDVLTADGIRIDSLQAGTIDTQNITIMDGDNTSFRWDKNGLSAYGFNEGRGYDLTSFVRMDKYGLYGIKNGDDYTVSSLDDLLEQAHFSLTWDGFRIKNSYGNGYVSISSDNDFEVVKTEPILTNPLSLRAAANNVRKITKVKIGAIEKDENGTPTKYGININNDEGETVFTTGDDGNITITGTINAAAGNIGGFNITDELSSGDFNQPGSIYLSPNHHGILYLDGLNIENDWVITAGENFGVNSQGIVYANDAVIRGTIYATDGEFTGHVNAESGNFRGNILVGSTNNKYITINSEGVDPIIASSDYIKNSSTGWVINGTGDAIFNNVSVRGAIKTAVFEYSEIEAVGGAFLFRPSSSIKTARVEGDDVILTVEKPSQFKQYEWVKASNCTGNSSSAKNDGGLTHVYKIGNDPGQEGYILLLGAGKDFSSIDIINDSDYYYYDEMSGENVQHDIIAEDEEDIPNNFGIENSKNISNLIEITKHNKWYYYEFEDFQLEVNLQYYISYAFQKYLKKAELSQVLELIPQADDEGPYFEEKQVVYIGNLAIFNSSLPNTGETFLIMSDNQGVTRIYASEENSVFFSIQKIDLEKDVSILEGGALISFGYYDNDMQYESGIHNYGIGINSSDNYVGLPERAISLFESKIHPDQSVKVTYDYKGILGTLPTNLGSLVNNNVYQHMAGTQGIFTNNMYIGDNKQYVAFYTDQNGDKQLKIKANQIIYEVDDQTGEETTWDEHIDEQIPIKVEIDSSAGNMFLRNNINSTLTCTVYKGNEDITSQVTKFTWQKKNSDGTIDSSWKRLAGGRTITIDNTDIDSKAIFICTVEF